MTPDAIAQRMTALEEKAAWIAHDLDAEYAERQRIVYLSDDCLATAREMQAEIDAYHRAVYEEEQRMERRQGL